MKIFVLEFCDYKGNPSKWTRYAKVLIFDSRNRKRQSFIISRKALPKDTKPGDKLEIIRSN